MKSATGGEEASTVSRIDRTLITCVRGYRLKPRFHSLCSGYVALSYPLHDSHSMRYLCALCTTEM